MESKQATELVNKYLNGNTTPEETTILLAYFGTDEGSKYLHDLVNLRFDEGAEADAALLAKLLPLTDRVAVNLDRFIKESPPVKPMWNLNLVLVTVAASILLAIGAFLLNGDSSKFFTPSHSLVDVDPGSNKATLTLADGSKIELNAAVNGTLAEQVGARINKTTDGQIQYILTNSNKTSEGSNSITTPNGGTYQVILPDGSKVWLNASSSLKYPVSFVNKNERKVEIIGEAYFQVAHNAARPFRVVTGKQTVEVLGTHFNVNGYKDDQHIITTLEEGSVKVSDTGGNKMLQPGEQSLNVNGNLNIKQADMETALAWKNGNIIFKSASIEEIMREVHRWYDIEVVYEGRIPKRVFSGGISRDSKLSVLLSILNDSGINFELKETDHVKKLIIKP